MNQQEANSNTDYQEDADFMSISAAAKEFGISQSVIRQGMRTGKVNSQNHKWGTRVHRGDVEKLKESRAHMGNHNSNEVH